jgi:hypothetical protein
MKPPNSDLRFSPPPRRDEKAVRSGPGETRGEDVSPVISDDAGVRQSGARDRADANRSRRRYITH